MSRTYCGACRGERGCRDCRAVGKTTVYTGLTGFFSDTVSGMGTDGRCEEKEAFCCHELLLAADLGTTTLAFVCADDRGAVLSSYGCENPQRQVAADVIGRVDAALHGQGVQMTNDIREALVKGFLFVLEQGTEVLRKQGTETDTLSLRIAVAGNTVMEHLLLGYPVDSLARAPFTPYRREERCLGFAELFSGVEETLTVPECLQRAEVTVFPCLSAFVGGDAVAGACVLFPDREGKCCLLIDLGTNGELLLWADGKLYGTAAAMGSAFEGGRFAYASDLFHRMAEAVEQGVADKTGLLCEPYFTEGFYELRQEDVREFQLAKGAIRTGIELLCRRAGIACEQVEEVFVAGGVGQYCRTEDLMATGLLPKAFLHKVTLVGNSCIGGLLSCLVRKRSPQYCDGVILNLAEEPEFGDYYYRYMEFESEEAGSTEPECFGKDGKDGEG